ncbi:MAG TPA: hypothetical protein VGB98_25745 [Pyrinomonadaceae bacterium]|jgi:hypothetical protein
MSVQVTHYVIEVVDGTADVSEPITSEEARDREARRLHEETPEAVHFWATVEGGKLEMQAYSRGFFEGEEEDDEDEQKAA